jgi:cell division protein FtsN
MYNFLFDKRSLLVLLTGLGVAGGVLFFAGVLVGVQWGVPLDTSPAAAPAGEPGRYSLQIGAFRDPKNSEKVMQDLQAKGYEPYVVEQKGRSVLQTVRIGRYADRAEAQRAASELRRREGLEAIVRPIGS